ncbi:MAG: hypothetical protein ABEJ42_09225 [Halobacteriaceae archaeon]
MPRAYGYPCPDCRTTNNLHDTGCRFKGHPWHDVEKAYVGVLSTLAAGSRAEEALRRDVPGDWDALHAACLDQLREEYRVEESAGRLRVVGPAERKEHLSVPPEDPLHTIYERGSVPGCHDNAVFALVSWYESVGFSWAETREQVIEWLHDSGTWERGGFEESSPEALLRSKRHVYERGYGWRQRAEAAKRVIESAGP